MTENENHVNKMSRDFKGIWIPREICLAQGLSAIEKLLWAEIDSLYNEEKKGCFASNEYLADFMGVKERTIRDALCKLRQLQLIEDVSFNGRERVIKALPAGADFSRRLAEWRLAAMQTGGNPPCRVAEIRQSPLYRDTSLDSSIETTTTTPPNSGEEKPKNPAKEKPEKKNPPKEKLSSGGGGGISFNHKTKQFDNLTPEFIKMLQETFPEVDIKQQLKEMVLWLSSNPHRTGTQAFITKWIKKNVQEKPKPQAKEEDQPVEVDPDLAELMKQRDERIKKEMEGRSDNNHE